MSFRHVACVVLALHTFVCAVSQDVPPQIPKQLEAIAPNQNFSSAKSISVAVTSPRAENPDTNADLERIRRRVLERLPKIPLTVVTDKASADLWLEVISERGTFLARAKIYCATSKVMCAVQRPRPPAL